MLILRRVLQIFFIGLIILLVVGVGALLIVNPTTFKDQISNIIKSHTGYEFKIQGQIDWSFRPEVTIHFKDMTLEGPEGFKSPVIVAKEVEAIINPYSLFSNNLIVKKLVAKDVVITIEHSAAGKRNIDQLKKLPAEQITAMNIIDVELTNASVLYQNSTTNISWALNNAAINTTNLQLTQSTKIDPINIKGTVNNLNTNFSFNIDTVAKIDMAQQEVMLDPLNINLTNFTLKGSTTIQRLNAKPNLTGKMTFGPVDVTAVFDGLSSLRPATILNTVANPDTTAPDAANPTDASATPAATAPTTSATDTTPTATTPAATTPAVTAPAATAPTTTTSPAPAASAAATTQTPTPVKTTVAATNNGKLLGEVQFAFNTDDHVLELSEFGLQLNDGSLKGNLKAKLVSPYQAEFDIMASKLDLRPLIDALNGLFSFDTITQDINTNLEFVKTLTLRGKLAASDIKLNNSFSINQLTANVNAKDGVLNMLPVSLNAMGGNHNFGMILDLSQPVPKVKISEQADNLELVEYLKLFNSSSSFVGSANVKLSLEGSGNDLKSIRNSASGIFNVSIKSGKFMGMNLDNVLRYSVTALNDSISQAGKGVDPAQIIAAKVSDWAKNKQLVASTDFELLDLKSQLNQGVSKSNVNISSTSYDVKATGNISLADGNLDFKMLATDKDLAPGLPQYVVEYVTQNPFNIAVKGTVGQITYTPDFQSYLQNGIKQIQEELTKKAITNMVEATGASTLTSKSAEQIFMDALRQVGQ